MTIKGRLRQMKDNKKLLSSGVAIVCILAILLSGTLAFLGTATVRNPFEDTMVPVPPLESGANLHDDFAGMAGVNSFGVTTKDIYVENTGERNVFVRIKLSEELNGGGANLFMPKLNATGVIQGAGNTAGFEWTLGSTTPKDYKSIIETAEWNDLVAPGQNTQLVADAYGSAVGTIADTSPSSILVAGQTQDVGGVISMMQYTALTAVQKDAFIGWVYDVDGFAYWSQALAPGTATGRLLTAVKVPGSGLETYTYDITAEMEYVDMDDLGAWLSAGDDGVRIIDVNADKQWDEVLTNADGAQIKEGAKAGETTIEASAQAKALINGVIGEAGVLRHAQTGDGTWIEIATHGAFSLIVKATEIERSPFSTSPLVLYADQDIDTPGSLRYVMNNWYDNKLAANAPLRDYVVGHDAIARTGITMNNDTEISGFSSPRGLTPNDTDVAFPLSYQEAARYFSRTYHNGVANVPSDANAIANFNKGLFTPSSSRTIALRTASLVTGRATGISVNGGGVMGSAGPVPTSSEYVVPALWVRSAIFDY